MSFLEKLTRRQSFWKAIDVSLKFLEAAKLYDCNTPDLVVNRYKMQSPNWSYRPLKIAVASDFHVGCDLVDIPYLQNVVENINILKPDIILMPGDFMNSPYRYNGSRVEASEIARGLSKLRAPGGVYASLGNHDVYEDPQGMYDELNAAGIKVLENESVKINLENMHFWIAGTGDYGTGHCDLSETFSGVTDNQPVIAMCHNPFSIYDMPIDPLITFAGHTHGGQYKIPFIDKFSIFKRPILDCPDKNLSYGLHQRQGRQLCVTSGIGNSLYPARNIPPEIVEFTLESG